MLNPDSQISRRFYRRLVYPTIALLVAVGLTIAAPHPTVAFGKLRDLVGPGLQVLQLSTLSDQQEVALGQQINQQLLRNQFRLSDNRQVNRYVTRLGDSLVPYSDRPNLPYTFQVVEDDSVNAFATMGGFVYVTTGLLQEADNEAQVAGVMAHEIGHIAEKHSIQQMRETIIARGLADAAGVDRNVAVQLGLEIALRLPRSRQHEYEADRSALDTMLAAGYAPVGLIQFFEKLLDKPSPPTFLSTHPASQDRIEALQQMIPAGQARVGEGLSESTYRSNVRSLF